MQNLHRLLILFPLFKNPIVDSFRQLSNKSNTKAEELQALGYSVQAKGHVSHQWNAFEMHYVTAF